MTRAGRLQLPGPRSLMPATYPTPPPVLVESDPVAQQRLDDLGLTFATDAEVNAAVAALQAIDALKQDAATAATDAELAAARAAIEAAMATDTELAAAVATLNAAIALKQDATAESASVTRDTTGAVSAATSGSEVIDQITRSSGRIASYRKNGTTHTITRTAGHISEVS